MTDEEYRFKQDTAYAYYIQEQRQKAREERGHNYAREEAEREEEAYRAELVSGFQIMEFTNGHSYRGEMLYGKVHGEGTYTYGNSGSSYTGAFLHGKKWGYGELKLKNGDRCEGWWKNDKKDGYMAIYYSNDVQLLGYYKDDKRVDEWTFNDFNGTKATFEYISEKIAIGTKHYPSGARYEGWLSGLRSLSRHGKGIYYLSDGTRTEGVWDYGKMKSPHNVYYPNGDVFVGIYRDGKRCGKGQYRFANGNLYSGEFVDDKFHGYGESFLKNNEPIFRGQFTEGCPHLDVVVEGFYSRTEFLWKPYCVRIG